MADNIKFNAHPIDSIELKDPAIRSATRIISHRIRTTDLLRLKNLNPFFMPFIAFTSSITTEYLESANTILIIVI